MVLYKALGLILRSPQQSGLSVRQNRQIHAPTTRNEKLEPGVFSVKGAP